MEAVKLSAQTDYRAGDLYEACGAISATLYPSGDYLIHGLDDVEHIREIQEECED